MMRQAVLSPCWRGESLTTTAAQSGRPGRPGLDSVGYSYQTRAQQQEETSEKFLSMQIGLEFSKELWIVGLILE